MGREELALWRWRAIIPACRGVASSDLMNTTMSTFGPYAHTDLRACTASGTCPLGCQRKHLSRAGARVDLILNQPRLGLSHDGFFGKGLQQRIQ